MRSGGGNNGEFLPFIYMHPGKDGFCIFYGSGNGPSGGEQGGKADIDLQSGRTGLSSAHFCQEGEKYRIKPPGGQNFAKYERKVPIFCEIPSQANSKNPVF